VFYVKFREGDESLQNKDLLPDCELVLKIYKQKDMKSFRKEMAVLNGLEKLKLDRLEMIQK